MRVTQKTTELDVLMSSQLFGFMRSAPAIDVGYRWGDSRNWLAFLVILLAILTVMITVGCGYNGMIRHVSMSIWEAVEKEDLDAIEAYVRGGGDLEVGATRPGKTPLLHALILKKQKSYTKLLALGANPNTICRGGGAILLPNSSVMHHAAPEEDPFWLRAALEAGGDPNQMNGGEGQQKGRPLRFAIMTERIDNVKLLCEHGADVDAPIDQLGLDGTLLGSSWWRSFEIVYHLLSEGADYTEPRPVHERNSFMHMLRHMKPGYPAMTPHNQKWFTAVWEWFRRAWQRSRKGQVDWNQVGLGRVEEPPRMSATSSSGQENWGRKMIIPCRRQSAALSHFPVGKFSCRIMRAAEQWQWSSLWRWKFGTAKEKKLLSNWPVARPRGWTAHVNAPQTEAELEAIRRCVRRGQPFGDERWTERMVKRLGLETTMRPRGRPPKDAKGS
jgi:hypothetical protein